VNNITIGMDLGDKKHIVCVMGKTGRVLYEGSVDNNEEKLRELFSKYKGATVAIEASTHSP
jgi:hypothetical protein